MKNPAVSLRTPALSLLLAGAALAFVGCEVEKTESGKMPEVKVEGGKMPEYDVKGPEVKVESKEQVIKVPDVDIVTPKEQREGGNVEPGAAAPAPAAPAP